MEHVVVRVTYANGEKQTFTIATTPGGKYENIEDIVYERILDEINSGLFEAGQGSGYVALPCLNSEGEEYATFIIFDNVACVEVVRKESNDKSS